MKYLRALMVLAFASALAACGGGGSSGGGGSANTASDGVYNGAVQITVRSGSYVDTGTYAMQVTIGGGRAAVNVGTVNGSAPLSADGLNFSVPATGSNSENGVTCTTNDVYTGTITGNQARGNVSGSMTCTQGGTRYLFSLSGPFVTTKDGASSARGMSENFLVDRFNAFLETQNPAN